MAGFAFALALDCGNEIHVEMHIEFCYSLSRYRESHLTTIKAIHFHLGMQLLKFLLQHSIYIIIIIGTLKYHNFKLTA